MVGPQTTTFSLHPILFLSHSSAPASVTLSDERGGARVFLGPPLYPVNVTVERWPFKIVYVPSNPLFQLLDKFQPSKHLNVDFRHMSTIERC